MAAARARLEQRQAHRRDVEKNLAAVQSRLSKFKDQLMEVKTNKEYTAMQSEIATALAEVSRLEDQVLQAMMDADEMVALVREAEKTLAATKVAAAQDRTRDSEVVAYIDGGSRGNPGPAGYGVRIEAADGALVAELGASIGTATNNVAEYRGLLAALHYLLIHGYRHVLVRSDSLLLVQQMLGRYRVKNAGLRPLHEEAGQLVARIGRVAFEHVRRENNVHADRLANAAMDDGPSVAD